MVEVMVLKPTCLFAWDNPTGQQLSGAVYLSLGLACCGPAGKGLLESMPDPPKRQRCSEMWLGLSFSKFNRNCVSTFMTRG